MSRRDAASLTEVADGVFAYVQPDGTWWVNNCGLVNGSSGALVVDSCATEQRTRSFLAAIRSVTPSPVRILVNTHHHSDHTFGNYLFDDAVVVAHEQTRAEVLRTGGPGPNPFWNEFDFGHVELSPPTLTYSESVTLWVDDLECRVRHVGTPAHTTNDSILWLPARRVLFAGDLLFTAVRLSTWAGRQAGLSPLEVALETDLGDYSTWSDPERLVGNLHRAYAELAGITPGARIDVRAAMTDMVTYNGGRPLTSRA